MAPKNILINCGIKFWLLILISLSITSCHRKTATPQTDNQTINTPNTPKIIFLNYTISTSNDNLLIANLHNKIIAEGTIKQPIQMENDFIEGDLRCIQLDGQSIKINEINISNPLVKNVEYVTDSGTLSKKQINLDSAKISVRMQLNPQTKWISLELNGETNHIILKTEI